MTFTSSTYTNIDRFLSSGFGVPRVCGTLYALPVILVPFNHLGSLLRASARLLQAFVRGLSRVAPFAFSASDSPRSNHGFALWHVKTERTSPSANLRIFIVSSFLRLIRPSSGLAHSTQIRLTKRSD